MPKSKKKGGVVVENFEPSEINESVIEIPIEDVEETAPESPEQKVLLREGASSERLLKKLRVHLYIDQPLYEKLEALSREYNVPRSAIMRLGIMLVDMFADETLIKNADLLAENYVRGMDDIVKEIIKKHTKI